MYIIPSIIIASIAKSPGRLNTSRISINIIIIASAPNSICRTLPISELKLQSMIITARIDEKSEISNITVLNSPL